MHDSHLSQFFCSNHFGALNIDLGSLAPFPLICSPSHETTLNKCLSLLFSMTCLFNRCSEQGGQAKFFVAWSPMFCPKIPRCNCTFHFQPPHDFLTRIQSWKLHSVLKPWLTHGSPHLYACWSPVLHCWPTFQPVFTSQHYGHCPRSIFCGSGPLSWGWGTNSLSCNWLILGQNCILSSSSPSYAPATPHPPPRFPWLAFVPLSDTEETGL